MALSSPAKLALGGAAVLGAGAWIGAHTGDEDQYSTQERATRGAMLAGAGTLAVAATSPLWQGRGKEIASRTGNYWGKGLMSQYHQDLNSIQQGINRFGVPTQAQAKQMNSFLTHARAVPLRAYAGVGAVVGAIAGGEDHRASGAALGAAAGMGVKAAFSTAAAFSKASPVTHGAAMLGLTAVAAVAGGKFGGSEAQETAGIETAEGTEYVTPQQAASYDSGVRRRMRNMNATGDMVFGMGARRRR